MSAELDGGRGHDSLTGGRGADFFHPGPGNDTVFGGEPSAGAASGLATQDRVSYSTATTSVVVDLRAGTATGQGTDALDDVEDVVGSEFDDVVTGSDSHNSFFGGGGADRLDGLGAADLLDGGSGDDVMSGGDGDDVLSGGAGGPGGDTRATRSNRWIASAASPSSRSRVRRRAGSATSGRRPTRRPTAGT